MHRSKTCSHSARAAVAAAMLVAVVVVVVVAMVADEADAGVPMEVAGGGATPAAAEAAVVLTAGAAVGSAAAKAVGEQGEARVVVVRAARTVDGHPNTSLTGRTTTMDRAWLHAQGLLNPNGDYRNDCGRSCICPTAATAGDTRASRGRPCSTPPQRATWVTGHQAACRSGTTPGKVVATVAAATAAGATEAVARVAAARAALEGTVDIARRKRCRQRICPVRLARKRSRLQGS